MKFTAPRSVLVDALSRTKAAVASRNEANPALSGVKLSVANDKLELASTNVDLSILDSVGVSDSTDGSVLVPAKFFSDIVGSLPEGDVSVTLADDGNEVKVAAGRSAFAVRVLPLSDFPQLVFPTSNAVSLSAAEFLAAVAQVFPSASTEVARPVLTGVLVAPEGDGIRLVSTDSYRLAMRDLVGAGSLEDDREVIVPARAFSELAKTIGNQGNIEVRVSDKLISFSNGRTQMAARLLEGPFPNYRQLIPTGLPNAVTVSRTALLSALKRVQLVSPTTVKVTLSDNEAVVSGTTEAGAGSDTIDGKYEGDALTVAFNPKYLVGGLDVIVDDEVVIELSEPHKPMLVHGKDSTEFQYLCMPVRV